jgi:hypothetical protein
VAKNWVLLQDLDGGMFLNGYSAIRLRDVKRVTEEEEDSFPARALRIRGEALHVPEDIDITSTRSLISSAATRFRLITVHNEMDDPSVCFIGWPMRVSDKSLRLQEVTPEAEWDGEVSKWPLSDITRVDFGGRYEDALLTVGGEAPPSA